MKLKNIIFSGILVKQLLFPDVALSQNLTQEIHKTNNKEKYSVIIAPETYRDKKIIPDFDQGIKNAFLISMASIYNSQIKQGYKPKNIHLFYADGILDTTETYNQSEIQKLIEDKYLPGKIKQATIQNIIQTTDSLSKIITSEDEFAFTIIGHGEQGFPEPYIKLPFDKNFNGKHNKIFPLQIEQIANKINAGEEIYIIDACYSGAFANNLAKENQKVFTSSTDMSPSLISRIDSFSRYLHYAKTDPEADYNKDGKITWNEAFKKAEKERLPMLKKHEKVGHTLFGKYPLEGFYGQKFNTGE